MIVSFSSPRNCHLPTENAGWCEAVEMGEKKKVGHLLYMEQPERQLRTLHLTALLSEPTLNPRTTALCHLELWRT